MALAKNMITKWLTGTKMENNRDITLNRPQQFTHHYPYCSSSSKKCPKLVRGCP